MELSAVLLPKLYNKNVADAAVPVESPQVMPGSISRLPLHIISVLKPEPSFLIKMKTSFLRHLSLTTALVLAAASQSSFAQTTATTDPVGFITLPIAGGGTVASPKLTLVSPTVVQPISWQGAITAVSTAGSGVNATTTITVSSTPTAPFTVGQYQLNGPNGNFYAEIVTTSPNTHVTGATGAITSTPTTSSIVVSGNLTTPNLYVQVGDIVRIRKETTIADIFGANNSAGLNSTDDPSTADEILLYNGADSVSYFYYVGDPSNPAGWYASASGSPAGNTPIGVNQGVVIKKKSAGNVSVTANGAVKTGDTLFPVRNGLNVLGTVSAKGFTLDQSQLYTGNAATGIKASDDPSVADEVTIYSGSTQTNYFYYTGDVTNAAGWYSSANGAPSGSVTIAPGTSFVLKRKGGVAFNWSLPSPTSF